MSLWPVKLDKPNEIFPTWSRWTAEAARKEPEKVEHNKIESYFNEIEIDNKSNNKSSAPQKGRENHKIK